MVQTYSPPEVGNAEQISARDNPTMSVKKLTSSQPKCRAQCELLPDFSHLQAHQRRRFRIIFFSCSSLPGFTPNDSHWSSGLEGFSVQRSQACKDGAAGEGHAKVAECRERPIKRLQVCGWSLVSIGRRGVERSRGGVCVCMRKKIR